MLKRIQENYTIGAEGEEILQNFGPTLKIKKGIRHIIPVTVNQLLVCEKENFSIEGIETNIVTLVGLITNIETSPNMISYKLYDQTGTIKAKAYVEREEDVHALIRDEIVLLKENTYVRVTGSIRFNKNEKYIVIYKMIQISDLNELTTHMLEVVKVPISLRKHKRQEISRITALDGVAAANFFTGNRQNINNNNNNRSSFTKCQKLVLRCIQTCPDPMGVNKNVVVNMLKTHMPNLQDKEIFDSIEFLTNEGQIFATIDDDHFCVTGM